MPAAKALALVVIRARVRSDVAAFIENAGMHHRRSRQDEGGYYLDRWLVHYKQKHVPEPQQPLGKEPADVEVRVNVTPETREELTKLASARRTTVTTLASLILEDWEVRGKVAWAG